MGPLFLIGDLVNQLKIGCHPGFAAREDRDPSALMSDNTYWVYVLASRFRGTLYIGVTNSLERRIAQHKAKDIAGFTKTYGVDRLVWFQGFGEVAEAIAMEKRLKRWRRDWKIRMIEEDNPHWGDLYVAMMSVPTAVHPVLMGPGLPLSRKPG